MYAMTRTLAITAALFACSFSARAGGGQSIIDADVTGNWFIPGQSGHGLQMEVLDSSRAVVTWYTFDPEGNPFWLIGVGDIAGDTIRTELSAYSGTAFPPNFDPEDVDGSHWGEIKFRRTSCDEGTISYTPVDPRYEPAEYPVVRLTRIDGSACRESWSQIVRWRPGHDAGQAFEPLFLDYPDGSEQQYELESGHGPLPGSWQSLQGLMVSGNNHSDDLMMVLMRPLDGLEPRTAYSVELEMQFATNAPAGCTGAGGSPGDSVFMRLGAATRKPGFEVIDEHRRATIDLGQQSRPGRSALAVGNMANNLDETHCFDPQAPWQLKRLSTVGQEFVVTSDESGRIWVYGLSDSGFEATTTWYLTEFVVRMRRAE